MSCGAERLHYAGGDRRLGYLARRQRVVAQYWQNIPVAHLFDQRPLRSVSKSTARLTEGTISIVLVL